MSSSAPEIQILDDSVVPFQLADTNIRGRIVTLSASIDKILQAHGYAPNISELTGEIACLVVLMGSSLKFDGKMILQAQGDGDVAMVVSDYNTSGEIRAMAKAEEGAPDERGRALLKNGHFAVTVDQGADMDRYQGVTPLEGDNMSDAAAAYFDQSEQIPTVFKISVGRVSQVGRDEQWRARGLMLQIVPDGGAERARGEKEFLDAHVNELWERSKLFLNTAKDDELLDPMVSSETLLFRLFHEDGVTVFDGKQIKANCHCNIDKIAAVLSRYDSAELNEMVVDGAIAVTCEFCRAQYDFSPDGKPMSA
ncbi:MAG: molecular chaperone Hsp33 [Marinicaulis sp.]|nr:Hsp33 family molecular chaperone HslO [Marinicaulis sp.]NNE42262.1 molecular chaperone Hsp33 [Marinicaulis sp.]NNL87501.1 molecular chaperone Hsp33 [Marinicaulis sp.]